MDFERGVLKLAYPVGVMCAIGCALTAYSLTIAWTNATPSDTSTYIGTPNWNDNGNYNHYIKMTMF